MKYKLLERNLEYIVNEIYAYRNEPNDMEYFVSIYVEEDGSPRILIDDIWTIDYAFQIYDFRVENIIYMTRDRLKDILKTHLTQSIDLKIY